MCFPKNSKSIIIRTAPPFHACSFHGLCLCTYMMSVLRYATDQCDDQLRNYCLVRFEDLEDRYGCQQTTPPPPVMGSTYIRWGRTVCANDTAWSCSGLLWKSSWVLLVRKWRRIWYAVPSRWPTVPESHCWYSAGSLTSDRGWVPHLCGKARPGTSELSMCCELCTWARTLMIPAKLLCPLFWTLEYIGYLVSKYGQQGYLKYECLDENPEFIHGLYSWRNWSWFVSPFGWSHMQYWSTVPSS